MSKSGRTRHSPEQIVNRLWEPQTMLAAGETIGQVLQSLEIKEATLNRRRNQYGVMTLEQAKRLKQLEGENRRLKKAVADLFSRRKKRGRLTALPRYAGSE